MSLRVAAPARATLRPLTDVRDFALAALPVSVELHSTSPLGTWTDRKRPSTSFPRVTSGPRAGPSRPRRSRPGNSARPIVPGLVSSQVVGREKGKRSTGIRFEANRCYPTPVSFNVFLRLFSRRDVHFCLFRCTQLYNDDPSSRGPCQVCSGEVMVSSDECQCLAASMRSVRDRCLPPTNPLA